MWFSLKHNRGGCVANSDEACANGTSVCTVGQSTPSQCVACHGQCYYGTPYAKCLAQGYTGCDSTKPDSNCGGSCAGRCGELDTKQPCQCDGCCSAAGDCCADFTERCVTQSQSPSDLDAGITDTRSEAGTDAALGVGNTTPSAGPDSCVDKCGQYTDGAKCQCDSDCEQYKDCCLDWLKLCGHRSQP